MVHRFEGSPRIVVKEDAGEVCDVWSGARWVGCARQVELGWHYQREPFLTRLDRCMWCSSIENISERTFGLRGQARDSLYLKLRVTFLTTRHEDGGVRQRETVVSEVGTQAVKT